jgi:hypothetical protein
LWKQPVTYFGGKLYGIFAKGVEKLNINSIIRENCMILKNFSLWKPPLKSPAIEGKKALHIKQEYTIFLLYLYHTATLYFCEMFL